MEKNRLSAKRSREKQKKRFEELEELTESLKEENIRLYKDKQQLKKTLAAFQSYVSGNVCKGCIRGLPKELEKFISQSNQGLNSAVAKERNQDQYDNVSEMFISSSSSTASSSLGSIAKISIFAGVLFVICLLGNSLAKQKEISTRRQLSEVNQFSTFSDPEYNEGIKFSKRQKEINEAISRQIELNRGQPLFKTYKDYSKLSEMNLDTYKEELR